MKPTKRVSIVQHIHWDAPHITEARRIIQSLARDTRNADRRVFMVTSAELGEGKSTVCALLGLVAARMFRRRTLLVDADMRRPSLYHLLGISQAPGLFEILHGRGTPADLIRATIDPTLFALPSGRAEPASFADAYEDDAFRLLLDQLRTLYDLIIIDAPPVVPVVESMMMAEHVDGILLVIMAGATPLPVLRRMRKIIGPLESKLAGVILNNASETLPYHYDHRYYGYRPSEPARRAGA